MKLDNEKIRGILTKGLSNYGFPHLIPEKDVNQESNYFGIIKRVIFVVNKYNGTQSSSREGILIDTPSSTDDLYINIKALRGGEGCYLGKCQILKIMDGDALGNVYVYLKTPI